jgi:hypothetical protein
MRRLKDERKGNGGGFRGVEYEIAAPASSEDRGCGMRGAGKKCELSAHKFDSSKMFDAISEHPAACIVRMHLPPCSATDS